MHPALVVALILAALAVPVVIFARSVRRTEDEAGVELLAELEHGPGTCMELAMRAEQRGRKIHAGVMHAAARRLAANGLVTRQMVLAPLFPGERDPQLREHLVERWIYSLPGWTRPSSPGSKAAEEPGTCSHDAHPRGPVQRADLHLVPGGPAVAIDRPREALRSLLLRAEVELSNRRPM